MQFEEFLRTVRSVESFQLPGAAAQFKMAPPHRRTVQNTEDLAATARIAAVLALIVPGEKGEAAFVLIERTGGSSVHASQFSFPGGKQEKDETLSFTALRETEEEIGIQKEYVEIVTELTRLFIPPSNFLVTPYLGVMREKPGYRVNAQEVQAIYEIPVRELLMSSAVKEGVFNTSSGQQVTAPFYEWKSVRIWGATAMMISEVIELIRQH